MIHFKKLYQKIDQNTKKLEIFMYLLTICYNPSQPTITYKKLKSQNISTSIWINSKNKTIKSSIEAFSKFLMAITLLCSVKFNKLTSINWLKSSKYKILILLIFTFYPDFVSVEIKLFLKIKMLYTNLSIKPIKKKESDTNNKLSQQISLNLERINKKCKFSPKLPTIHPNIELYHNFMNNAEYSPHRVAKEIQIMLIKDIGIIFFNIWIF